jgi:uncharacterized HAD superfamily protein
MKQKSVLELKKELIEKNISGIALDIDETIASTCEFWITQAIIKFGNPTNLTPNEIFKKYKVLQNVPFWNKDELHKYIEYLINDEKMHSDVLPFEKINSEIDKLHENINIVAYITARPEFLYKITEEWLVKHKFPGASVILKPENISHKDGNKWKARVLEYLYPQVCGIVDDNPKLGKEISDEYKGKIYLLSYETHENEKHNVVACYDWDKVHLEILKD